MVMHMCKIRKPRFVKKLFNTWRMGCIYIHVQEQSISKFGKLYWLLGVCFNFKVYDEFWKEVERWNNTILSKLKEREQNTGNERDYSYLEAAIKKIYDKTNGNIICYEYYIW